MRTQRAWTCQAVVERISDYLEGALHWADRARLEAHLAHCANCRAYLAELQQTIRWLGQLGRPTVQPATRRACLAIFRAWKQG
jgi:anti-sigma factor RsiW